MSLLSLARGDVGVMLFVRMGTGGGARGLGVSRRYEETVFAVAMMRGDIWRGVWFREGASTDYRAREERYLQEAARCEADTRRRGGGRGGCCGSERATRGQGDKVAMLWRTCSRRVISFAYSLDGKSGQLRTPSAG